MSNNSDSQTGTTLLNLVRDFSDQAWSAFVERYTVAGGEPCVTIKDTCEKQNAHDGTSRDGVSLGNVNLASCVGEGWIVLGR